jgi:hypothetical protein
MATSTKKWFKVVDFPHAYDALKNKKLIRSTSLSNIPTFKRRS